LVIVFVFESLTIVPNFSMIPYSGGELVYPEPGKDVNVSFEKILDGPPREPGKHLS
jgi:hypothetical protein